MTINRDFGQDRAATRKVLAGEQEPGDGPENWLGHRSGTGANKIDKLLIEGATLAQMGETRGAVDKHLYHLRKEHSIHYVERDGVFSFDRDELG